MQRFNVIRLDNAGAEESIHPAGVGTDGRAPAAEKERVIPVVDQERLDESLQAEPDDLSIKRLEAVNAIQLDRRQAIRARREVGVDLSGARRVLIDVAALVGVG